MTDQDNNHRPDRYIGKMFMVTPQQGELLRQAAYEKNTSMSALVRQAIDDLLQKKEVGHGV